MSELRSVVEELRSELLPELPDARIEEDFAELHRAMELLEVERLRRLAEIERRRLFERDGHLSAASWLAVRHKLAWGSAREHVRIARALEEMPRTRRALEAGDVSMSAVRVLVSAREVNPQAFERAEGQLVEAARIHTVGELQRVLAYWRQGVERGRLMDPEEGIRSRRRLHASVSFLGMVRLDGDLDPESGETLLTALGAVLDAESRGRSDPDPRTAGQRRADALTEICRQWLDRSDRPMVAGERPHITVTVDAETLRSETGTGEAGESSGMGETGEAFRTDTSGTSELDHAGPIGGQTVRRLACDASVMRVVMAGRSEPLDVGRRMKVVPPAMRRAVIVRDRTCRFPGCDRPHTWCDVHHVVLHWADGGPTATSNLVLLCRRHHRLVHLPGGFRLQLVDGRPLFKRSDGSVLDDRAPP
ncbi:MAG TPA: DUF222 domain-containing protein [Actinomycetota bacterium]|jgi:hypothetical protein|nr:DUF222 domain-containing protein [Actinomycetota bacterium]